MAKGIKTFRIASIYENSVLQESEFVTASYSEAYEKCIEKMREDPYAVAYLIFSNQDTAIVIKRKYAEL